MDPQAFLDSLCRRHGVAPQQAEPLLPLVQLAWTARPPVRRRLLKWVEDTLERGAQRDAVLEHPPGTPEGEQELLALLAKMLHRWRVDPAA
jgi:hypothetical protein